MTHFGSRVIGREKAAEEAAIDKVRANHFGPRVIGDVLAARLLAARKDDGALAAQEKDSRSDPATKKAKREAKQEAPEQTEADEQPAADVQPEAAETPEVDEPQKPEPDAQQEAEERSKQRAESEIETIVAPTTTNLEELQSALEGNPALYEALYDSELKRVPAPRKSALRLFLVFEMEHEDREDRKSDIEAALKPKG